MASKSSTPLQMALSVVVVCAIAAAGLAATYAVTKEPIAAAEKKAEEDALKTVLPEAVTFESVDDGTLEAAQEAGGETPVSAAWKALDSAGQLDGWGVRVGPRGYGGPIQMVIGMDREGSVTGVMIVTMNETPGLGTRVRDESDHLAQYAGLDAMDIEKELKNVDAITGATKSSRGVRHGVEAAAAVFTDVLSGEGVQE